MWIRLSSQCDRLWSAHCPASQCSWSTVSTAARRPLSSRPVHSTDLKCKKNDGYEEWRVMVNSPENVTLDVDFALSLPSLRSTNTESMSSISTIDRSGLLGTPLITIWLHTQRIAYTLFNRHCNMLSSMPRDVNDKMQIDRFKCDASANTVDDLPIDVAG